MEEKENKRVNKIVRRAENFPQPLKGNEKVTPIKRLRDFTKWAQLNGLCKSEHDFERQCQLSPRYIANSICNGKGNLGTEMLGRIISVFPQLNLAWLCTGEGAMLNEGAGDVNADYKQAYEAAQKQIEILNRIILSNNV